MRSLCCDPTYNSENVVFFSCAIFFLCVKNMFSAQILNVEWIKKNIKLYWICWEMQRLITLRMRSLKNISFTMSFLSRIMIDNESKFEFTVNGKTFDRLLWDWNAAILIDPDSIVPCHWSHRSSARWISICVHLYWLVIDDEFRGAQLAVQQKDHG